MIPSNEALAATSMRSTEERLEDENLTIPSNEAQAATSMRPTEETKRINMGFSKERKTAIVSSSLDDK
jgi:hypothetical protein